MTTNSIEVEFLEDHRIEEEAEGILAELSKAGFYDFNSATNLDLIAEKLLDLGILFEDLDSEFEGVLGALDLEGKTIIIDQGLDNSLGGEFLEEGRLNFTIAHEIGHFVLHRDKFSKENSLYFHNESNPYTRRVEIQANKFAAALLMPRELVIKKWNQELRKEKSPNDIKSKMAQFFRTSRETTQFRLQNLGLI